MQKIAETLRRESFYLKIPYVKYFEHVEEIEWAIEVCKASGKPVASTMCIGPEGDMHGIPASHCAVRMARAGELCHFYFHSNY